MSNLHYANLHAFSLAIRSFLTGCSATNLAIIMKVTVSLPYSRISYLEGILMVV